MDIPTPPSPRAATLSERLDPLECVGGPHDGRLVAAVAPLPGAFRLPDHEGRLHVYTREHGSATTYLHETLKDPAV